MKEEIIKRIKEIDARLSDTFNESLNFVNERYKRDELIRLLSLFVNDEEDINKLLK